MKVITTQAEQMRDQMRKALEDVEDVSITLDIWSDRTQRSFLGVTCHFNDGEKYITNNLATQRITGTNKQCCHKTANDTCIFYLSLSFMFLY